MTVTLSISGMSCGHCLQTVNRALHKIPGARVISVQMGRAEVELGEGAPTPEAMASLVSAEGYPATVVASR